MDIFLDSNQILCEDIHFIRLQTLLHAIHFASCKDILHVFLLIDVGDITRIQNVIDIFEHLFIDNLCIYKKERQRFVLYTSHHECFLYIVSPRSHVVVLDDFNLEELIIR